MSVELVQPVSPFKSIIHSPAVNWPAAGSGPDWPPGSASNRFLEDFSTGSDCTDTELEVSFSSLALLPSEVGMTEPSAGAALSVPLEAAVSEDLFEEQAEITSASKMKTITQETAFFDIDPSPFCVLFPDAPICRYVANKDDDL